MNRRVTWLILAFISLTTGLGCAERRDVVLRGGVLSGRKTCLVFASNNGDRGFALTASAAGLSRDDFILAFYGGTKVENDGIWLGSCRDLGETGRLNPGRAGSATLVVNNGCFDELSVKMTDRLGRSEGLELLVFLKGLTDPERYVLSGDGEKFIDLPGDRAQVELVVFRSTSPLNYVVHSLTFYQ